MIRILVVDDQNLVREGIKILLEKAKEIKIVGEAKNGSEAMKLIETLKPDVVLLDIEMPGVDGLTVADKITVQFPQVKVIMLSSHEDSDYVEKATNIGAKGYLLKSVSSQELEWSVRLVDQGYSAIKSELLEKQLGSDTKSKYSSNSTSLQTFHNSHENVVGAHAYGGAAALSQADQSNFNQLEALLVDNQLKVQSINYQRKKRKKKLLHGANLVQLKKTMGSFEFKLLILVILFSLGFLTFVALS